MLLDSAMDGLSSCQGMILDVFQNTWPMLLDGPMNSLGSIPYVMPYNTCTMLHMLDDAGRVFLDVTVDVLRSVADVMPSIAQVPLDVVASMAKPVPYTALRKQRGQTNRDQ
jgi:hypothetical protein